MSATVECIGISRDGRTTRWRITCPKCSNKLKPRKAVLPYQVATCRMCRTELFVDYASEVVVYSHPERDHPKRVQFNRFKGQKLPPNTVLCTRPSRWGNPYKIGDTLNGFILKTRSMVIEAHKRYIDADPKLQLLAQKELRGKDLACNCGLDEECHVDYLLKVANL